MGLLSWVSNTLNTVARQVSPVWREIKEFAKHAIKNVNEMALPVKDIASFISDLDIPVISSVAKEVGNAAGIVRKITSPFVGNESGGIAAPGTEPKQIFYHHIFLTLR